MQVSAVGCKLQVCKSFFPLHALPATAVEPLRPACEAKRTRRAPHCRLRTNGGGGGLVSRHRKPAWGRHNTKHGQLTAATLSTRQIHYR